MTQEDEYVLGTDELERERLRHQHTVWLDAARQLWERAGFRGLATLLDLGCGPGFTSLDLAAFSGPGTRVLAVDESPRFIAALCASLADPARGTDSPSGLVEPQVARVEQLELPDGSIDGVYARWLFSWLADPGGVLARVARMLRPGGRVALHEYLHWGSFALLPPQRDLDLAVRACLASWSDVTIDVAAHVADHAAQAGLAIEHFEPLVRIGGPGSPVWSWLEAFHRSYLPRLVQRELIGSDEVSAALRAWQRHAKRPDARVLSPTLAAVVLRKPA